VRQDCSISWGYIVKRVEEEFGIKPDSDDMYAMCEIEKLIELIWDKFVDEDDNG